MSLWNHLSPRNLIVSLVADALRRALGPVPSQEDIDLSVADGESSWRLNPKETR